MRFVGRDLERRLPRSEKGDNFLLFSEVMDTRMSPAGRPAKVSGDTRVEGSFPQHGSCERLSKDTTIRPACTSTTPDVSTNRQYSYFGFALSKPRSLLAGRR